ncbi:MAG: EscU/YscU/HrcU family type III secretion system export apparatus switch protein [Verrucomicrobiota bacterium]|nr:EscU/YscU/HrcU family type III secretion system export apparatus switch protein [Verrucomicrobiota bacterium]
MSEAGNKTEQATPRRMEEAIARGQFPRSTEIQTAMVLMFGMIGMKFAGTELWTNLVAAQNAVLGHLHDIPISQNLMQGYLIQGSLVFAACTGPIILASMVGGLLAGGVQSKFQAASEALDAKWERLNPVEGLKRIFSVKSLVPTLLSTVKVGIIAGLSYSQVDSILHDPIFYTSVDVARIAEFLATASGQIATRVLLSIMVIAALDYSYQFWQNTRDLMMTREEVKEELKNSEGDPQIKARLRRRRKGKSHRQMLADVPKADVIVTNPTHLAIALQYDRKTMKAPKIIAKGSRLNALKIREIAGQHQIPIIENKPLARLMFKYGKVGGEVPAQLYAAVAEILAYVYRVNRYRYYAQANQG